MEDPRVLRALGVPGGFGCGLGEVKGVGFSEA